MKTARLVAVLICACMITLFSCQRNANDELAFSDNIEVASEVAAAKPGVPADPCNPYAYTVLLESKTPLENGTWEWVWSVQNPNPGNGSNGTAQDLSHWGMAFESCFNFSHIVDAAYSADGFNWTSFTPYNEVDPSQACYTGPVLKFDYGTTGSNKSYYRITVNSFYRTGLQSGYYKSGGNTGCCTFDFFGVRCASPEEEREEE
jgi:hypothetical protein